MKRAKSVEDYITTSSWPKELKQLRKILLSTKLVEGIKWGAPCYTYNGKNVVGLGSFKSYFGLWFHQGALLADKATVLINAQKGKTKALRQWRMMSAKDIKPAVIKLYVKEAIQLVVDGKRIGPDRNKPIVIPPALTKALQKNKAMAKHFSQLTPGRQREYADYVAEAKRDATKLSRIEKILPMIEAGQGLHDKYR